MSGSFQRKILIVKTFVLEKFFFPVKKKLILHRRVKSLAFIANANNKVHSQIKAVQMQCYIDG